MDKTAVKSKVTSAVIEVGSASCRLVLRSSSNNIIKDKKFSPTNDNIIFEFKKCIMQLSKLDIIDVIIMISYGSNIKTSDIKKITFDKYPDAKINKLSGKEEAKLGLKIVQNKLLLMPNSLIIDLGGSVQIIFAKNKNNKNKIWSFKNLGFNAVQKKTEIKDLKNEIYKTTESIWQEINIDNPINKVIALGSMPIFMFFILGKYNGNPLKNTGKPLSLTGKEITNDNLEKVITLLEKDYCESVIIKSKNNKEVILSRKINLAYAYQLKKIMELANNNSATLCTYEWRHVIK